MFLFVESVEIGNILLKNTRHCPTCLIMGGTSLDEVTGWFNMKFTFWTRIRVSNLFATLSPWDKNLYLFGARCSLGWILKSLWSRSFLILGGRDSYFFEKRIKKINIIFLFTYRKRTKDYSFSCVIINRGC